MLDTRTGGNSNGGRHGLYIAQSATPARVALRVCPCTRGRAEFSRPRGSEAGRSLARSQNVHENSAGTRETTALEEMRQNLKSPRRSLNCILTTSRNNTICFIFSGHL